MAARRSKVAAVSLDSEIAVPCSEYLGMKEAWCLIEDLMGGTRAMRKARTKWLPMEEGEQKKSYERRLAQSVLFEGYKDAARKLSSKPFSKPVTLAGKDKLPEALQLIEDDADNAGTSLTQFGKILFDDARDHGLSHFLVDFPRRDRPTTEQDVREGAVHPYFIHVPAASLIGWTSRTDENGQEVLTSVRILEERREKAGRWGQRCVRFVRVWTEATFELWREDDDRKGEFAKVEDGENTLGYVPLVTLYFEQAGFMTANPPLEGLAWLNLEHWQSSSDQRNILHVARVPFLHETGVAADKVNEPHTLSVGRVKRTNKGPAEADMKWVETQGSSIKAGSEDLDKIEDRMQVLGMQPLVEPTTPRTATEVGASNRSTSTALLDWVGAENDALYVGFEIANDWIDGDELPEDFAVQIHNQWEVADGDPAGMDRIEKAFDRGVLTRVRYAKELKRRSFVGEDFDPEKEVAAAQDDQSLPEPSTPEEKARLDGIRRAREQAERTAAAAAMGGGSAAA